MRPSETRSLLEFEKWVNTTQYFCLDWIGNDSWDHSKTWDAWEMWNSMYQFSRNL